MPSKNLRESSHPLLDGRDVGERTALDYIVPTEEKLKTISDAKGLDYAIASGGGRQKVTMDRYNSDWNIVKLGWDAHVRGEGRKFLSASEAVKTFYRGRSEGNGSIPAAVRHHRHFRKTQRHNP